MLVHVLRALSGLLLFVGSAIAQQPSTAGAADWSALVARADDCCARFPELVQRVEIGRSVAGRPLFVLRVSSAPADAEVAEVYLGGGIHGHERSEEDAVRMLDALIAHRAEPAVAQLLRERVVWVQLAVNPDGIVARTRKNARGVDLNRNFDGTWLPGDAASERDYPGSAPFSEPETRAVRDFLRGRSRLRGYLDLHRSASIVIVPPVSEHAGPKPPATIAAWERMLAAMGDFGHAMQITLPGGGFSIDWVWSRLGVMAFTLEFPSQPPVVADTATDARWSCLRHLLESADAYPARPTPAKRPNVVVVMTDDQGYGDFGFLGNPLIRTPRMDALAAASVRMESFYVHPVCAPTRAALMTGRWPQRTRAIDTWIGRAMMEPSEVTVAELLHDAGYATGVFGKWHLGDCYPLRAIDQGFEMALVHRGGGIAQPSDPEGGERRYTDPVLFRNGERVAAKGYCTDVFFDAAIDWIGAQCAAERPFFCYVPTNAPHGPWHDVPAEELSHYDPAAIVPEAFPDPGGRGERKWAPAERIARTYAMLENIDTNLGRLLDRLGELGVLEDTLVLFLCDNGPEGPRYVGGLRGTKSSVYEGGVRTPLLAHWPGHLEAGVVAGDFGVDIDLLPTICEACGVRVPEALRVDGKSLLPVLAGEVLAGEDRVAVIQAHRGDVPVRYHHAAVRTQEWKLVNHSGFGREIDAVEPHWELFAIGTDPFEKHDLAADRPEVVARLQSAYEGWFDDIASTRPDPFAPPRIVLGSDAEPDSELTRQDWRRIGHSGGWGPRDRGVWLVNIDGDRSFDLRIRFVPGQHPVRATLAFGAFLRTIDVPPGASDLRVEAIHLPAGPTTIDIALQDATGTFGPLTATFTRT